MPTPPDDILLGKASTIERCIRRIQEEFKACPALDTWTHLDAMTLNVERACQAAIDMAMHLVARHHLGAPQAASEAFAALAEAELLSEKIADSMRAMVGFRNIAIHQYTELDRGVLKWIAQDGWNDWVAFCRELGVTIKPNT